MEETSIFDILPVIYKNGYLLKDGRLVYVIESKQGTRHNPVCYTVYRIPVHGKSMWFEEERRLFSTALQGRDSLERAQDDLDAAAKRGTGIFNSCRIIYYFIPK